MKISLCYIKLLYNKLHIGNLQSNRYITRSEDLFFFYEPLNLNMNTFNHPWNIEDLSNIGCSHQ